MVCVVGFDFTLRRQQPQQRLRPLLRLLLRPQPQPQRLLLRPPPHHDLLRPRPHPEGVRAQGGVQNTLDTHAPSHRNQRNVPADYSTQSI